MAYSDDRPRDAHLPHIDAIQQQQQQAPYFPPPPRQEYSQYSSRVRHESRLDHGDFAQPVRGQPITHQTSAVDDPYNNNANTRTLVPRGDEHRPLAGYDANSLEARTQLPPPPPGPPPQTQRYSHASRPRNRYSDSDSDEKDYESSQRYRRRKRSKCDREPDPRDHPYGTKGHRFNSEDKATAASALGGAGGALLGARVAGGGVFGVIGGIVAGALGAGALEDRHERKKNRRKKAEHGSQYSNPRRHHSDDEGRSSRRSRRHRDEYNSDDY